ncbi:thioredoxin family protein [Streptomyces sp. NPDC001194]|uniref:thioredoxin family protein n=1 Tax=Streptomyces sp. NPDC001194 TaxID=3364547 RepID=UPI0036CD3936
MRRVAGALGSPYERNSMMRQRGPRDGSSVQGDEEAQAAGLVRLGAAELGASPGRRASLVQFSSAFCQPCRATRRILADVASLVEGVEHIEIDAEARLELVRALGIEKTPTVLVLDAGGRIVRRAVGMPRKADVIAALGAAI